MMGLPRPVTSMHNLWLPPEGLDAGTATSSRKQGERVEEWPTLGFPPFSLCHPVPHAGLPAPPPNLLPHGASSSVGGFWFLGPEPMGLSFSHSPVCASVSHLWTDEVGPRGWFSKGSGSRIIHLLFFQQSPVCSPASHLVLCFDFPATTPRKCWNTETSSHKW